MKKYKVTYSDEPFCEHCGSNHDDFAAEVFDKEDDSYWCTNCAWVNGTITDDEYDEIEVEEKKRKKEYYKNKLEEIK